jgi:cytochrome bd-type quinol oxidase subunit 2
MKFLSQGTGVNDIFGTPIEPPGPKALYTGDIRNNFATLFSFVINMAFVAGAFFVLIFLLWGAFDIIASHGDKENMERARRKLTNAVVGLIVLVAVFVIWITLTRIFGLTSGTGGNIQFKIPGFGN